MFGKSDAMHAEGTLCTLSLQAGMEQHGYGVVMQDVHSIRLMPKILDNA